MSVRYRKKAFAGRVDDRDTTVASIFAALANLKRPAITLCAVVVVVNEFARLSITILGTYRLPRAGLRRWSMRCWARRSASTHSSC